MEILKKIGKVILHIAIWIAIFIAAFFVTAHFYVRTFEVNKTINVETDIPELFPILVVYPATPERPLSVKPIYYKNYSTLLSTEKDFSFLVPAGMENKVNELLKQQSRGFKRPMDFNQESENPWEAHVTVEKSENGKQTIRFFETWDDDRMNTGWYEARDKTFAPQKYLFYFGPSASTPAGFYAFVLLFALILAKALYKSFRRLQFNTTIGWRRNTEIFAVAIGAILEVGLLYFYLTSVIF